MTTATKAFLGAMAALALLAGVLGTAVVRGQEAAAPAGEEFPALVKDLAHPDHALRRKAWDRLKAAGEAARPALEEGAASADPQVRWASRRLLQATGGGSIRPRGVLRFGGEEEEAAAPGQERGEAFRATLDDLRRRIADLEREAGVAADRFRLEFAEPPFPAFPAPGAGTERTVVVERNGERTEVRVAADGKVTTRFTRRDADGKAVEEIVEAKSLEDLAKENPAVHGKVKELLGDGGGFRIRLGAMPGPRDMPLLRSGDAATGARPVLGVVLAPVPDLLRVHCALPEGEGQVIEEVLPGTLAARTGLRRHDVLLGVNGLPAGDAADVRAAVEAVPEGKEVVLRVLRAGRTEEVRGTR
jgi:hypothetical protein